MLKSQAFVKINVFEQERKFSNMSVDNKLQSIPNNHNKKLKH